MITEGVDYSFARPQPQALHNAGKKFAVRYGGPGSDSKHLHLAELNALRAVGIDVVANAEGTAGGYSGAAAGRSWAQTSEAWFRGLGMKDDRPIYFSIDFDAGPANWAGIDAALKASAAVIGLDRVGVYGSYDVITHCRAVGLATWFWQTYAWSGGKQADWAHLYQYRNGVTIGGGDCDLTRALVDDYGQWGYKAPEEEMTPGLSDEDKVWIAALLKQQTALTAFPTGGGQHSPIGDAVLNGSYPRAAGAQRTYVWSNLQNIHATLAAILAAVGKDNVDEAAIVSGVLAGISPEAIASAIPQDIAEQVAQKLAERLAS